MTSEVQDERPGQVATERAEELVDRMGEQVGRFASLLGLHVRRMAALAREEADDMWAEAQSIRRREPS